MNRQELDSNVRGIKNKLGLSLYEIARDAGLSEHTIYKFLHTKENINKTSLSKIEAWVYRMKSQEAWKKLKTLISYIQPIAVTLRIPDRTATYESSITTLGRAVGRLARYEQDLLEINQLLKDVNLPEVDNPIDKIKEICLKEIEGRTDK